VWKGKPINKGSPPAVMELPTMYLIGRVPANANI